MTDIIGRGRYARAVYPVAKHSSAGPPPTDELVKITVDDTTANFLASKVASGAGIILEVLNPTGDEQLQFTSRFQILRAGWVVAEPQALAANGPGVFDPVVGADMSFPTWVDVDGSTSLMLRGKWGCVLQEAVGLAPITIFRVQVSLDNGVSWKGIRNVATPTCFQESRTNQGAIAAIAVMFHFAVLISAPAVPPRVRIVYNAEDGADLIASGSHMLEAEAITNAIVFAFPGTELEP